jgi:hypothetical protein
MGNTAATVVAILASAVVVLGGIAALVRAIWRTATTLRENTLATRTLTAKFDEHTRMSGTQDDKVNARLAAIERELSEHHGRGGAP